MFQILNWKKKKMMMEMMEEKEVKTGGTGTFKVIMKMPKSGKFKEFFTPVIEGVTWMKNKNSFIEVNLGGVVAGSGNTSGSGAGGEVSSTKPSGSNKNIADKAKKI